MSDGKEPKAFPSLLVDQGNSRHPTDSLQPGYRPRVLWISPEKFPLPKPSAANSETRRILEELFVHGLLPEEVIEALVLEPFEEALRRQDEAKRHQEETEDDK